LSTIEQRPAASAFCSRLFVACYLRGKAPNNPYFKGDLDEVALYGPVAPRSDRGARRRCSAVNGQPRY
jgi:hypothetical protein